MRPALLVSLALALAACDLAAPEPSVRVDLATGARLDYTVTDVLEPLDGERTEASWTSTAEVVATDATVREHEGLVEMRLTSTGEGGSGRVWYRAGERALSELAYDGAAGESALRVRSLAGSPALPLPLRRLLAAAGAPASGAARVDPVVRSEPRVVLAYPAEVGQGWVHYDFSGIGFPLRSLRRIEAVEDVTTPAGTFRCLVVRTTIEFAGVEQAVDWVDHVADVGLVRREMTVRDPETDADGVETGRASVSTFRQELTAVSL